MTGPLISGGETSARGANVMHETRARSPVAKWMLGLVGFFAYLIPGAVIFLVLSNVLDALEVSTPSAISLVLLLWLPVLAAWRGFTVAAVMRPGDVVVRNRWRKTVVPLGEIESVEVGTSFGYALLAIALWIWYFFSDYSAIDGAMFDQSDMLIIRRRGTSHRIAVSATLGMGSSIDGMQPFFDALAAAGHPVVPPDGDERPS